MGTHPIFESDFDCLTEMSGDPLKGCEDILADGSPPRESSAQNITIPSIRVDQLSVNESRLSSRLGILK